MSRFWLNLQIKSLTIISQLTWGYFHWKLSLGDSCCFAINIGRDQILRVLCSVYKQLLNILFSRYSLHPHNRYLLETTHVIWLSLGWPRFSQTVFGWGWASPIKSSALGWPAKCHTCWFQNSMKKRKNSFIMVVFDRDTTKYFELFNFLPMKSSMVKKGRVLSPTCI